jgi:hypothetical protein
MPNYCDRYLIIPEKSFFSEKVLGDHFKICFVHIRTDKSGRTIKIFSKQLLEKRQKESFEELSQIKTTTGQNRVHTITTSVG